ncbi:MAG: hypothetical protein JW955_06185 [Sedimentisphaerales bacterium]|nr:hypothetical protein [Sedimentisphaerales bacterium]
MNPGKSPDMQTVSNVVQQLRAIAVRTLPRMYCRDQRLFAFRLREKGGMEVREGTSRRYTAIVLIALAGEDRDVAADVLGDHRPEDVCTNLIEHLDRMDDLGEVALTTWAARALGHSQTQRAIDALRRREPWQRSYPIVELSWALTALVADGNDTTDMAQAQMTGQALLGSFRQESGLFLHQSPGSKASRLRAHVSCFADFVYPIQALSHYHIATADHRAAEVAGWCAERMCQLQGPAGQWWWHYDVRTGQVLERYPVYAVHQHAMAPMCLFALARACGQDHSASIRASLRWLVHPAENTRSLIDTERNVIWRKVTRREPRRLVRGLQAAVSGVHPSLRVPAMDVFFPPVAIDYETRPYEMGWLLYAWPVSRDLQSMSPSASSQTNATVSSDEKA